MRQKKRIFFQKKKNNFASFFDEMSAACEGLVYVSETDAPVKTLSAEADVGSAVDLLRQIAGADCTTQIESIEARQFFARLTAIKDWFGPAELERAKKFLDLQRLLEENLTGLAVYRVGEIRVRYYAIGRSFDGRIAGIETEAVET